MQAKTLSLTKLEGNRLDFALMLPALPEGKYALIARLKKGADASTQRQATFILAPPPHRQRGSKVLSAERSLENDWLIE